MLKFMTYDERCDKIEQVMIFKWTSYLNNNFVSFAYPSMNANVCFIFKPKNHVILFLKHILFGLHNTYYGNIGLLTIY